MSPARAARVQSAVAKAHSASGVVVLVATAALLFTACGSSGSSTTASATSSPSPSPKAKLITDVNACTLVTEADATAAAGTQVTSVGAAGVPGACFYGSADGMTSVLVIAQAYPDASSAAAVSPEQLAAAMRGAYGIANAKVVTGIGDKAVEYSLTGSGTSGIVIFVFKSNVVIMIAVSPTADSSKVELAAKTAVGRL